MIHTHAHAHATSHHGLAHADDAANPELTHTHAALHASDVLLEQARAALHAARASARASARADHAELSMLRVALADANARRDALSHQILDANAALAADSEGCECGVLVHANSQVVDLQDALADALAAHATEYNARLDTLAELTTAERERDAARAAHADDSDAARIALIVARNALADERDARHNAEGNAYANERERALADNADDAAAAHERATAAGRALATTRRRLDMILSTLADAHNDDELLARACALADATTHDDAGAALDDALAALAAAAERDAIMHRRIDAHHANADA